MLQYQHNESKSKLLSLTLGQSGDVIRKMQGPIHDPSVKHTVLCCSKFVKLSASFTTVNVKGDIFVEDLLQDLVFFFQIRLHCLHVFIFLKHILNVLQMNVAQMLVGTPRLSLSFHPTQVDGPPKYPDQIYTIMEDPVLLPQ